MEKEQLTIAMISVHSSPIGELGTKDTGGMSVYIRELARELGSRGHSIDIYTRRLSSGRNGRELTLSDNVRLINLPIGNNGHLQRFELYPHLVDYFRELEAFRRRENLHYDLIHSHYWLSGRVGEWAQDRWDVPHILKYHTIAAVKNNTPESEKEPELRVATEKHLAKACQRILAATETEKEQLTRYYGVRSDAIGVVPCGVDLDLFHPMDKSEARRRLGLAEDDSIVLYVGRFAPLKGLHRLLEALTHLKHHKRLRLVIVGGDGEQAAESRRLLDLSDEWGIRDRVRLAGRIEQKNLPRYYSAADLLVVPSHYESFGLVALESLACGTPVVATPVGAMKSILREGETGSVVHNVSARSLANAIERFLREGPALSTAAIRESILQYGWSEVASATIDEYTVALRDHSIESFPLDRGVASLA